MVVIIVLFITFWNEITSLRTSGYTQTLVIKDKCFNLHFKMIPYVKSQMRCSAFCSRDSRCKRFMHCGSSASSANSCFFFENGNDCVVNEGTGTDCKCFVQMYSNCESGQCECPAGKYGVKCQEAIKDCSDSSVLSLSGSGLAYIKPTTYPQPFEVQCDFSSSLTFFHHRKSSCTHLNFNRSYSEYVKGFGNCRVDYWLGLEKIYAILENEPNSRLDVGWFDANGNFQNSAYKDFKLGNATTDYVFYSSRFWYGDTDDALLSPPSIGDRPFSTYDNDHTGGHNCPINFGGGWWYAEDARCTNANLNGIFDASPNGITWLNNSNWSPLSDFFMRIGPP